MFAKSLSPMILVASAFAGALLCGSAASAHDARHETVTPIQKQSLPDAAGKEVVVAVVSYAPGQAPAAHEHADSVFAYVLEGEIISQLAGQPPVVYTAGQSWYEAPRAGHLVSKNASATKPAKLIAWLLVDQGAPLLTPLGR